MARILLVDDDEMVRELLALRLETKGHDCVQAMDGAIAIDILRAQNFDLIVLDMLMPKMDGLAFLKATLGIEPNLPPILVLSATRVDPVAFPFVPDLQIEVLRKPASAVTILTAIETILGGI